MCVEKKTTTKEALREHPIERAVYLSKSPEKIITKTKDETLFNIETGNVIESFELLLTLSEDDKILPSSVYEATGEKVHLSDNHYISFNDPSSLREIDGKYKELHPEVQEIYIKANDHYKSTQGHHYSHILINSAVRNVQKQYGLYKAFVHHKFFGGPSAPAANQPGSSNHEYGLAIDIIRKQDEVRLTKSLEANGWKKHQNPKEPWHFDATGIASYASIQSKILNIKKSYSSKIADGLWKRFEAEKKFEDGLPQYQLEDKRLNAEASRLTKEQASLNAQAENIKKKVKRLENRIEAFNRSVERNRKLRRRINRFSYTYCPNNNSFDDCRHNAEKSRYVRERNALVKEYNDRAKRLGREQNAIKQTESKLKSEINRFETRANIFRTDADNFKADVQAHNKEGKTLLTLRKVVEDFENTIDEKLNQLASKVNEVRAGS